MLVIGQSLYFTQRYFFWNFAVKSSEEGGQRVRCSSALCKAARIKGNYVTGTKRTTAGPHKSSRRNDNYWY